MNPPTPDAKVHGPHGLRSSPALIAWPWRYGIAIASVIAAFGVRLPLEAWVGGELPTYITFYPVVMVAALLGGIGPGLVATLTSGLIAAFFIEPRIGGAFLALPVDRLAVVVFSGMGLFMSLVAHFYHRNREKAAAYDREEDLRAINREKAFLADLLENADQPFAVGYLDGRLGLVNRAFEQLTGYNEVELHALDWSLALTPPEWRVLEREKLAELARHGQPVRYEKEYLRKDGTRVPIELQVNLVRDAAGQPDYYYSFLTDISERKRAEAALRRQKADLVEAQRLSHVGSWSWDAQTDIAIGSDELLRIYGFDPATQTMPDFADQKGRCYPVEDWEQVNAAVQLAVQTGVGYELDVRVFRGSEQVWATTRGEVARDAAGGIIGLRGTVQDITERKRAEVALRESESRERQRADELATLFEVVPMPVFIVHDSESTHITGNRAADELLLLPRGAEVSLSAPPESRPRHFKAIKDGRELRVEELPAQRAARGEVIKDFEFSLHFDDGAILHLLGYGTPLRDEEGRPRGAVHVLVDITGHKQAEAEIRQLNAELRSKVAELEAANRELEGFTYSVSHDLRAPIRHMVGFARLLEMKIGPGLDDEARNYLGIIANAADRLGVLIDELLAFSRMGRAEVGIAEVDLGTIMGEVVENIREITASRRIEWRLGELPKVKGDPSMLRFVVENLIDNAVKFTATREQACIEVGAVEDEGNHIVFVKDNGAGFDMAYYDKLFGVFQRLHRQEEFAGTGIGLANVQRIIHRHGGRVWADSKVDQGATFFFSLPRKPQGPT